MKRSEVAELSAAILTQNVLVPARLLRAALRQAANSIEVPAATDDQIKTAFVGAFNVKTVAAQFGCTPSRVSSLAKASGLTKLGPGVYQA